MNAIAEYCKRYVRKYKTEEAITEASNHYADLQELNEIRRQREERQTRANEPFKKKEKLDRDCYIYLIKDRIRGFHKIGKAKNVSSRFSQLKTANPGIELVYHYRGKESDERALHSLLDAFDKRVDGEWFNLDDSDIQGFQNYFSENDLPF